MPEGRTQSLAHRQGRLVGVAVSPDSLASALQRHGERRNDGHETGEQEERRLPAIRGEEGMPKRRERELPKRARGGGEPHCPRAALLRNQPSQGRDDDGERAAGEPEPTSTQAVSWKASGAS